MADVAAHNPAPYLPNTYFEVARMDDGRYCVQFIKYGAAPRKSYTVQANDVVKQALRAGHVPVLTHDEELRRACRDQKIDLLSLP